MLDAVTPYVAGLGIRVLQGNRLGATEADHVAALHRFMTLPPGATVADLGCGTGEVARILGALRPDLRFLLVNYSGAQLAMAPSGTRFARLLADFHALPLADGCADVALHLYSLCHGDPPSALAEAARIVRRGGSLFIYDLARERGDNAAVEMRLFARFHPVAAIAGWAEAAGWSLDGVAQPVGDDLVLRGLFPDPGEYDALMSDLRATIWRFTRRAP
ncbi:class I SAM-dependent methyltransferase [Roseomonas sp. OT10]|uniref:class I SAM-dependent methyltransferase n=1 Tax=Roseomonas cutis TaxID=2897332 RepID=UPI001E36689E|nr:class I SAM-dependent methyltransferase [Roseomonas sp. OT10]UFN49390.1 class I SAM-dependent methyltransferase [Roseomonas sp. OT10]